jgi:peptidoglycan/LPS O-acetylase OafA/YrhL
MTVAIQSRSSVDLQVKNQLSKAFSVYLDLLRFLAALSVILHHTFAQFASLEFPGHEAVVVFFVLSGYVITLTASRPGMTLSTYLQHRVARIVPVAWVALLLGLILSISKGELPLAATLANMFFLGQSGFGWFEAPLNVAFWSLNYEVWYYVIFAAWIYSPPRYRTVLTIVAMVIAGPKILMLFPVWLMGVWLYRKMPALDQGPALAMYWGTLVLAALLWAFDVSDLLRAWLYHIFAPAWRAHHSTQLIYDILLGFIVTAHLAAAASVVPRFDWLTRFETPIRYLAGFSFSMYAFHGPLGELYQQGMSPVLFYAAMAIGIFLLAQMTERQVTFFRSLLKQLVPERR